MAENIVYMKEDGSELYCEKCKPPESLDYPASECEADHPHHCDTCFAFLRNPLTHIGFEYVISRILDSSSDTAVVDEWREYYDITEEDIESFEFTAEKEFGYYV